MARMLSEPLKRVTRQAWDKWCLGTLWKILDELFRSLQIQQSLNKTFSWSCVVLPLQYVFARKTEDLDNGCRTRRSSGSYLCCETKLRG